MFNRRQWLQIGALGAAGGLVSPPWSARAHEPGAPSSSSPLLTPFVDPLPVPPVSEPMMQGKTRIHTLVMRAGLARLHRDLPKTVIWGFNGVYPGPTIRAVRGEPVVIRQINRLPLLNASETHAMPDALPAVHLHGAHVAPEHDGHPRESIPQGGFRDYHYPNTQRGAALFYHDHSHGHTGRRVYFGLAGTYLIEDPAERLLNLPRGEFDVPLLIQDRVIRSDGSLEYVLDHASRESGVFGDLILVNGVVQPFLRVKARKYRFRIINGSNARIYDLQLSSGRPLVQIGCDGGLLPSPIERSVIPLAPSERADVVIDFAAVPVGSKVILRNCAGCSGSTAEIMQFEVAESAQDDSSLPDCLSPWENLSYDPAVPPRQFELNRRTVNGQAVWVINDRIYSMSQPPMATVRLGAIERWRFVNPTNHPHPVHIHLVQFQVLNINGVPQDPARHGWKDTLVAPAGGEITVIAHFTGYTGRYLMHCHNLEHEDLGMMADFEIIP